MRKIRKFKTKVRLYELGRRAKKARLDREAAGLAEEEALRGFAEAFHSKLEPAVIYESFPPDHALAKLAPVRGLGFSLGAASLGRGPEMFVRELLDGHREGRAAFARLAERIALEDAVGFVSGLVRQEAADEECELSPIEYLLEPALLEDVLETLCASKIGVSLEEFRLAPPSTAVFSVSWIARKRAKGRKKPARR